MNIKFFFLIFFLALQLRSYSQNKLFTDTGYIIHRIYGSPVGDLFFIHSKAALLKIDSAYLIATTLAADKQIGLNFLYIPDSVISSLTKEFAKRSIKLRNESQRYCMIGIYSNFIEKYKDDYFHVALLPAIITYIKNNSFVSPLGDGSSTEHFEISSFGRVIMDTYSKSINQFLVRVQIIE